MAARVSFLIDGDGRIVRVFPDVDPALHAQEVLQAAAALSPTAVTAPAPTAGAPPVTTSEP
jgi:peroxiredoxin Q/BCP